MVEHVVVGGGTSAVLLSRRLLDEGHKVILLEKGANRHKNTATPVQSAIQKLLNIYPPEDLWTFESRDGRFTKQVESFPQRLLNDRVITYSSASGIGGNSNVNAMICDIGSDNIYDNFWPPSWNSKRIHGYAKIVDKLIHQKEMRTSGNMKALMETIGSTPLQQIYLHYRATIDPNDCSKRWKLGNMLFDEDYESSGQLTIVYDFNVDHIEIENGCAVAVVDTNGQKYSPKNGGEIVIAAGVFESPKLLHRSGIDLSGLGKHLQDHVVVPYISVGNWRNNWNIFKMRPRKTHEYPLNGVHGWVFLDKQGNVLDKFSPQVPR
jgi:choline dehydrogenase-like flavoprotein